MNRLQKKLHSLTGALALMTAGSLLAGCGEQKTYVLVHGAWQDSRGWEQVARELEGQGHKVLTPDLLAHGQDTTPAADATLQGYTDQVVKLVDAQEEDVILVGHSMGGTVVSQVAEARPDKVRKLVYLAAYLLPAGETLYKTSMTDDESKLGPYLEMAADYKTLALKPGAMQEAFCHDCAPEQLTTLSTTHAPRPEPVKPMDTPLAVTEANWGRVPRVYIETLQDRTLGPALQKRLYTQLPVERVISMDTGHLPFLTQPQQLAGHLSSL